MRIFFELYGKESVINKSQRHLGLDLKCLPLNSKKLYTLPHIYVFNVQ
jgi:hypothetical protein